MQAVGYSLKRLSAHVDMHAELNTVVAFAILPKYCTASIWLTGFLLPPGGSVG